MRAPYPMTLDEGVLIANCERLGIPIPLIACGGMGGWYASQGTLRKGVTSGSGAAIGVDDVFTLDLTGASTSRARYPAVYIAGDMTVIARCKPTLQTANASCGPLNKMTGISNVTSEWCLGLNLLNSGTEYKPWFGVCIGTTLHSALDPDTWAVNERLTLGGVRRYDQVEVYRNGNLKKIGTCGTGAINNVITDIQLGQWGAGGSFNLSAQYSVILIWDQALPSYLVAELTADPWMLWDESPLMNSAATFHDPINLQTITHGVVLSQVLDGPTGQETMVSETMGRIAYGGRQITRIGSRIYTVASDAANNKTYCFYSDDTGNTWTQELVVNYAAVSASISQGAGSQPVLALVADGTNEIRPYLRSSGGGWTHKTDVGTGSTGSVYSHQILYDGTNYHLIYGRARSSDHARQVRHSYSSNMSSWTHATLDTGDTAGRGPYQDKAIAACIDLAGGIHVVYTQVDSNRYELRYQKRTGSTWGSTEVLQDLGDDNTIENRAIHLCIATDRNSKPYVVGTKYYSGNWKMFLQDRVSGTWSTEEVPVTENTDMRFPSLGFQDRQYPTLVYVADYDDATVHKIVRRNGAWNRSIISAESGVDAAEQVYDPRFNNAIAEQGSFVVYQASVIVFVTSTLVWGDTGAASGDATFTQNVRLTGRDKVTHSLVMGSVLSDPNFNYTHSVEHIMPFSHTVGVIADRLRVLVKDLLMGQDVGYMVTNAGVTSSFPAMSHHLSMSDVIVAQKTRVQSITHSLVMSQVGPGLTRHKEVEDTVELGQSLGLQVTLSVSVASGLSISDVVHLNKSVNVGVTHGLTMSQGVIRLRSWSYNSTHYDPGWAAEYEGDVLDFVIMGPDEAPTLSMTLPKPDFGDEDTLTWRADSVRRNRTGAAKVFRAPIYESYRWTWSGFMRKRAAEFRNIIKFLVGKNVRIRDHNGVWKHVVISNATMTSSQSGPEFCNVELSAEEKSSVA